MSPEHVDLLPSKKTNKEMSRRDFVHKSSGALISSAVFAGGAIGSLGVAGAATKPTEASLEGRIYKTLKIGMVESSRIVNRKICRCQRSWLCRN